MSFKQLPIAIDVFKIRYLPNTQVSETIGPPNVFLLYVTTSKEVRYTSVNNQDIKLNNVTPFFFNRTIQINSIGTDRKLYKFEYASFSPYNKHLGQQIA